MPQSSGRRPTIVCLSGSTRFRKAFEDANRIMTLRGYIVLSCGVFAHAEGVTLTDQDKANLDSLHLAKVDLADSVFVINPGGYIGPSTRAEIAYAQANGKPVVYLVPPAQVG